MKNREEGHYWGLACVAIDLAEPPYLIGDGNIPQLYASREAALKDARRIARTDKWMPGEFAVVKVWIKFGKGRRI